MEVKEPTLNELLDRIKRIENDIKWDRNRNPEKDSDWFWQVMILSCLTVIAQGIHMVANNINKLNDHS